MNQITLTTKIRSTTGLCLYMGIIVANRLKVLLQECGIEEQFGSQPQRGTIDALFCL
jgi:hypothetical protein